MNSKVGIDAQQRHSFTTLFVGIFINSPFIDSQKCLGISETSVFDRYGTTFLDGLTTFSRLSIAERMFLVTYLQK